MDKTRVKRLAEQTGMVMPYTEDHLAFLERFANACCSYQKDWDAMLCEAQSEAIGDTAHQAAKSIRNH